MQGAMDIGSVCYWLKGHILYKIVRVSHSTVVLSQYLTSIHRIFSLVDELSKMSSMSPVGRAEQVLNPANLSEPSGWVAKARPPNGHHAHAKIRPLAHGMGTCLACSAQIEHMYSRQVHQLFQKTQPNSNTNIHEGIIQQTRGDI